MLEGKIKVLVVEDTLVTQKLLLGLIKSDARFELVGVVENGKQACEFVSKIQPDVISMDILMPVMDGVEATRRIMQNNPIPIVIVSSFYQSTELDMAMRVLKAGAVSIIPRPYGPGHSKFVQTARQYLNTLKSMSEVKVVRRNSDSAHQFVGSESSLNSLSVSPHATQEFRILAIGASAGGPEGLTTILSGLPSHFPLPVLVVQHIDSHFADGFATWLNTFSKLPVSIAKHGEKAMPGRVYLPPGDHHLTVVQNGTLCVSKEAAHNGLRPSVDVLFSSIAKLYGSSSLVILLSGMGKDGAVELKKLFDLGAFTIAQEEKSCLVYGMPGEAAKLGAVCKLLSPANIVLEIKELINF